MSFLRLSLLLNTSSSIVTIRNQKKKEKREKRRRERNKSFVVLALVLLVQIPLIAGGQEQKAVDVSVPSCDLFCCFASAEHTDRRIHRASSLSGQVIPHCRVDDAEFERSLRRGSTAPQLTAQVLRLSLGKPGRHSPQGGLVLRYDSVLAFRTSFKYSVRTVTT